jgi:UPF0716 family protein affecting phage T7 exclusion
VSNNPLNLALRFILEIAALVAVGIWGWHQTFGITRYLFALGLPIAAAAAWGLLRVPEDASASGEAPIPVAGIVRLVLELGLFAFAGWGLFDVGFNTAAFILGGAAIVHYLISFDRIGWLLRQ